MAADIDLTASSWRTFSTLLDRALELPPEERLAWVDTLGAEHEQLKPALRSLLQRADSVVAVNWLDALPHLTLAAAALDDPELHAAAVIGPYRLLRELGVGGMGAVWLAERADGTLKRQIALKLPRAVWSTGLAQRMARERDILASLEHPNIARLYDAGTDTQGRPYLALEYVEGQQIDVYCREGSLSIRQRLQLLLDVARAVTYAHSRLVIHRDLKPGNILVTADSQVRLLDFGIAKLMEGDSAHETQLTQLAGRALTLDYASPEQIRGEPIGTASDVYSLGVVAYEVLTGTRPYRLKRGSAAELEEAITSGDAPVASASASEPTARKELRGDLDAILATALRKVPDQRYASVDAFAQDIERHLRGEPVQARPDSSSYRLRKFVGRNRLAVGAALIIAATLVAGVIGTMWQAIEAERQRSAALQQRDRAQVLLGRNEAISDFVGVMFSQALPAGQAKVVQEMLERSERLIDTEFADQPAQQAEVLRVLGSYYTQLSLPSKHYELLTRARAIVERVPDRSLQARLDCDLGRAASLVGKHDEGAQLLERWGAATDIEPAVAVGCLRSRAQLAQSAYDPAGALRYAEAGLERLRASGAARTRTEATLLGDVAFAQHLVGRNAEADRAYQAALEQLRALGAAQSLDALRLTIDRGVVRYAMSDYRGGIELLEQGLAITERQGRVPPGLLANLAFGLEQLGRYDEALRSYERAHEAARASGFVAGEAYALVGRASVLTSLGQVEPAQASLRQAEAPMQTLPPAHSARIRSALAQARIDIARGDDASAEQRYAAVIDRLLGQKASTPTLVTAYRGRAEATLRRGDAARALDDAEAAVALARKLQGSNAHSDVTGLAFLTLARVLHASGAAERWPQAALTAHAELEPTLGADHPQTRAAGELAAQR